MIKTFIQKIDFNINDSNKKLIILFIVFILSIALQFILNYGFNAANQKLDSVQQNRTLTTNTLEEINKNINNIQILFYQSITNINLEKDIYLRKKIQQHIQKTKQNLNKLNTTEYLIVPIINKLDIIWQQINALHYINNTYNVEQVGTIITMLEDIIEEHRRYYVKFQQQSKQLKEYTQRQKNYYQNLQILFIMILIIVGIYGFYKIGKQLELINKDLSTERNTAIKAVQSKSEFLSNMNHEIRTPLNAILGFIGLLKSKKLDTEGKEYLETIQSSGEYLLAIVNDILDYSKIEENKITIDAIDFDTTKEFNILKNLFVHKSQEKNITFEYHIGQNIPQVLYADIFKLKQIIINLIANAVKFTPPGGCIVATLNYKDTHLFFSVQDEGIGISEEDKKHIFDKFSQAKSSTTREYGGTGLGLAISSKLVKILGGELTLKSEVGVGSTFSFNIPVQLSTQHNASISPNKNHTFNGHILLVEDNKSNQMLMQVILSKQGITFDIAGDGIECLEMFKKHSYDLILMDNHMPRMSGVDACKHIREYEKQHTIPAIPIIALTASTTAEDRQVFIQAGMDAYLSKPIEVKKLQEVFTKFL